MGRASITAGAGPFRFGESVPTEAVVADWSPGGKTPDGGYWARVDGYQGSQHVYAQFADLTPPTTQSGFTFGPTPSWSNGAAHCTVRLFAMNNGAFSRALAEDSFEVEA